LGASLVYTTAIVPTLTPLMIQGPYEIPALRCELTALYTNTCPTGAYRGAGRPEASYYLERVMDLVADEAEVDPAEVRRRNFIPSSRFPYKAASGAMYDSGDYAKPLDEVLRIADYKALRTEQAAQRRNGKLIGVGLASYVEICGFGPWELGAGRGGPVGVDRGGGRGRLRRQARPEGSGARARGHQPLQIRRDDLPLREPPLCGRDRSRDGAGPDRPVRGGGRLRAGDQPAARGRPGPRRHRPGREPGPAGGGQVR